MTWDTELITAVIDGVVKLWLIGFTVGMISRMLTRG